MENEEDPKVQSYKDIWTSKHIFQHRMNYILRNLENMHISRKLPVFAFAKDGCTTACMVITPFGSSPKGALHWPTVLLFSNTFPAFISFMSFAPLGTIFLSKINQKT